MFFLNNQQKINQLGINIQKHIEHYVAWHSFSTEEFLKRTDVKKILVLNTLLNQPSINYAQINTIAKQIKSDQELQVSKQCFGYMDNNIFRDLFAAPYRIATSPLYFLQLLVTQPTHCYVAVKLLLEEIARLISTIIFPIAILYSKYKTDSYNVLAGDLSRMLDSTIALTEIEMKKDLTPAMTIGINMQDGSLATVSDSGVCFNK